MSNAAIRDHGSLFICAPSFPAMAFYRDAFGLTAPEAMLEKLQVSSVCRNLSGINTIDQGLFPTTADGQQGGARGTAQHSILFHAHIQYERFSLISVILQGICN